MNHSRLVCIAPDELETGPQRMKISILGNHTSMSQEVCVVSQNDYDFWQNGTTNYFLENHDKCLGTQGRKNDFSGNCSFETRLCFFLSNSKSSCVHYRLDQQLLLHYVTEWARCKWVLITRNWEQRETAVYSGLMWLTAVDHFSPSLP